MAEATDFRLLYDAQRHLFSIGFNVTTGRLDTSYYDLLASESRLASLVAIALGQVPQVHWFRLGRQLAPTPHGGRALLSWSGTMFEHLMPLLVTRTYEQTLLDETYHAVVARHIEYAPSAGCAVGHLRVGLQHDGPGAELPVPRFRRAGPGIQARPRGRPRGLALLDRAGAAG